MISVIVPVYNTGKYLPKCIDSILAQTYRDLELILVDDGSADDSGKICDDYAAKDRRVRVFHKENGGSSSARNLGITKARGEYIGFIDSDDFIEPDMYECLLAAIMEKGLKCAQVGRDEIDEEGNLLPDICTPPDETILVSARDFLMELLMHRGDCSFCTKLIAREIFFDDGSESAQDADGVVDPKEADGGACSDIGKGGYEFFPKGVLNEDFYILVKKLRSIGTIASLPGHKYHVFYRVGSNSRRKDKNDFSRVFGDCVDNADMVSDLVLRDYPEDKELIGTAFRFGVFQRLEYLLHIPTDMMMKPAPPENGNEGSGKDTSERMRVYTQYREIVGWMRHNYFKALGNPVLTFKNKIYHTLFAIAPRGVRLIHKKIRNI